MAVPRVFHPEMVSGRLTLSPEESHHLRDVLRCRLGDGVTLFDGTGHEAAGRIVSMDRRGLGVEAGEIRFRPFELSIRLTLAVAMPRAPRQAFLFEKCTELGVWALWPIVCERSVVRPKPSQALKWRRTALEACRQSGRAWIPQIQDAVAFENTLSHTEDFELSIITDAEVRWPTLVEVLRRKMEAAERSQQGRDCPATVLVWVGPEGGLTREEIDAALAAGALGARLGPNILRVETAAVAVAGMLHMLEREGHAESEPA